MYLLRSAMHAAEYLGFGKTLICLVTILATKGHLPPNPPEYSLYLHPILPKKRTSMQMTAGDTYKTGAAPFRFLSSILTLALETQYHKVTC